MLNFRHLFAPLIASLATLCLLSCNVLFHSSPDRSNDPTITITGVVQVNRVAGAIIVINNFTSSVKVGEATADANGVFSATISPGSCPCVILASGGTYVDEVTGTEISLDTPLKSVVSSLLYSEKVPVTPLTTLVTERLIANSSKIEADNINDVTIAARLEIAEALGTTISVIWSLPTDPDDPAFDATSDAGKAAYLIAVLDHMLVSKGIVSTKIAAIQDLATAFSTTLKMFAEHEAAGIDWTSDMDASAAAVQGGAAGAIYTEINPAEFGPFILETHDQITVAVEAAKNKKNGGGGSSGGGEGGGGS